MNEDGSLGIPHGAPSEEETPSEAPIVPNAAEELLNNSANTSTEDQLDISHDTPIENQTVPVNSEPIDIFAQQGAITPNDMAPESNIGEDTPTSLNATSQTTTNPTAQTHLSSNPFSNRNHYQHSSQKTGNNIPQFFSNAIAANTTTVRAPRKSRKGLFIGIGIGLLALIAVIALLSSITIFSGKPNYKESKSAFNRYANKLLFNSDSDKDIPDREKNTSYSYEAMQQNNYAIDSSYIFDLISLYDNFSASLAKLDQSKLDEKLKTYAEENKSALIFIQKYSNAEELAYDDIYELYAASPDDANSAIESYLSLFSDGNNSYMVKYKSYKEEEFNIALKLAEEYANSGCLSKTVDQQCIDSVIAMDKNDIGIGDLSSNMFANSNSASQLIQASYSDLSMFCWEIRDMLNGGNS
jgi:hypothetical protein